MLDAQLNGGVALSAMGGGTALGGYYTGRREIVALAPEWVIAPFGTNDLRNGGPGLVTYQLYMLELIAYAKTMGCRGFVVARLRNTGYGNYDEANAWLDSIAAADPFVRVWRWDLVESDPVNLKPDGVHRSAAGEQAVLYPRLEMDVPELFD